MTSQKRLLLSLLLLGLDLCSFRRRSFGSVQATIDDEARGGASAPEEITVGDKVQSGVEGFRVVDKVHKFNFECTLCRWGAQIIIDHHRKGKTATEILDITTFLCRFLGIESKPVCKGMVYNVGSQLFDIFDMANGTVQAVDICAMAVGGKCSSRSKRLNSWSLDIPDLNKTVLPTKPPAWPKKASVSSPLVILHFSDVHLQLDYTVGADTRCGEPICCFPRHLAADPYARPEASGGSLAGPMGDFSCDLPPWTFEKIVENVAAKHDDVDFIFLTGDFPAHDSWKQNRSGNLESLERVVHTIQKYFPDTLVFPTVGNHESFPVNMFPDPDTSGRYSPKWLYDVMAKAYSKWLPDQSTQRSLRNGGYYSVSPRPGLRIISLNTNFCNSLNFWTLINFNDPHNHLHWLYNQLLKAEAKKERAYIIGHIPPGLQDCLGQWSHEYNRIVHRFPQTIAAQFFGHTHLDELEVFFGTDEDGESVPINVAYIAPSQTPVEGVNPSYRLYLAEGLAESDSYGLLADHTTFWLNLTELNSKRPDEPFEMKLEYSVVRDLSLDDLSPESWWKYVQSMAAEDAKLDEYRRFSSRYGPSSSGDCDTSCRKELLCRLVTSNSKDLVEESQECRKLRRLVDASRPAKTAAATFWTFFRWT